MNDALIEIWRIVEPLVTLLVGIVGPVLVTWIGARIISLLKISDDKKKLEVEAQLREALHKSAANAVKFAVSKTTSSMQGRLSIEALNLATRYVQEKNPDAIEKLGVSEKSLAEIILAKAAG